MKKCKQCGGEMARHGGRAKHRYLFPAGAKYLCDECLFLPEELEAQFYLGGPGRIGSGAVNELKFPS
jgi:hypothetical protein